MNFLFLSKLLPLFIYPLSFAFFLLLLSLIIWWKYPRFFPIPVIIASVILWLASNVWVSNLFVSSLEWQYPISAEEIPPAPAIVILGGGIKSQIYPRPMIDVAEQGDRVIYGAKLYKMGKSPLIVPTGGRISWKNKNTPLSEAEEMTELLSLFEIPSEAIIEEKKSLNTYENAIYTKEILSGLGINNIILVTSALHMPRSVKIFEKQGFIVNPAPTDFLVTEIDLQPPNTWQDGFIKLFPSPFHLHSSTSAIKEYLGIFIYQRKGWL